MQTWAALKQCLAIGFAGSLGALARFFIGNWFPNSRFPLGTMIVNISGCFVLGFFMAVIRERFKVPDTTRLAIASGFVGAYTTFSTLMYDCVAFSHRSEWGKAGLNLGVSVVLGLAAVWVGVKCGERI